MISQNAKTGLALTDGFGFDTVASSDYQQELSGKEKTILQEGFNFISDVSKFFAYTNPQFKIARFAGTFFLTLIYHIKDANNRKKLELASLVARITAELNFSPTTLLVIDLAASLFKKILYSSKSP